MGTLKVTVGAAAALLAVMATVNSANAAGSVSASYFTLTSANPDIGGPITGVVIGLVKNTLGPDGLPVESTPGTFANVNANGELLWWTPQVGLVLPGTTFAYPTPFLAVQHSEQLLPGRGERQQRRQCRLHFGHTRGHFRYAGRRQRDL
jgi:hypothetical protein